MKQFFFEKILQNSGWKSNVLISTDESGIIKSIEENTQNETLKNINDSRMQNVLALVSITVTLFG